MTEIERAKHDLRQQAHAKRAAISPSFRDEAAIGAAETFSASVPIKSGQVISLYWGIRDELSTEPLLIQLMDEGHQVCLPVVMGKDQPLEFRLWKEGEPLEPSGFGTLAPSQYAQKVEPKVLVMPLLGFDANGMRLGYGGGYYDRSVAGIEKPTLRVGYAFADQEFDQLAFNQHDMPLDMVVTEAGVRRFDRNDKG